MAICKHGDEELVPYLSPLDGGLGFRFSLRLGRYRYSRNFKVANTENGG